MPYCSEKAEMEEGSKIILTLSQRRKVSRCETQEPTQVVTHENILWVKGRRYTSYVNFSYERLETKLSGLVPVYRQSQAVVSIV